eukprot:SAG31_NODE_2478_length_5637_cov_2.220657_3_plen_197_part_00
MVGTRIRLEQSDAHIRRQVERDAAGGSSGGDSLGFHGGTYANFGRANSTTSEGLYRFPFVKTLTNLTDLTCPEDGGTVVIAGSHKLDPTIPTQQIIDAAMADPAQRCIHQVIAPAGSTLCFHESLIHASGQISTGRDRLLVISGWSPTNYQPWSADFEPDPALLARVTPEVASLLTGGRRWATKIAVNKFNDKPKL